MITQFELSAYGVEEMNKKEMIEIDGGSITLGLVLIIVGTIAGVVGAYYTARGYYDSDKNTVIATKELRPTYIHNADSIKIFPDGTMYIYGGDACFGPCNK